jgi:hypothetical protein
MVGRLEFHVFSDEKPTKKTKHESFYLLDSWKADIPSKFGSHQSVQRLPAQLPESIFQLTITIALASGFAYLCRLRCQHAESAPA